MMKYLDKIANIAVILAVVIFIGVVLRGEIFNSTQAAIHPPQGPDASAKALIGSNVNIPDLPFPRQHSVLLLVISTGCHFCKESLPFYKDLAVKGQGKIDVVAFLPQDRGEAHSFLEQAQVSATQVISADLGTIGINATPTLLLIDRTGKVQAAWVGKLSQRQEQQVLERIYL